jgi:FkbM family methyltransferase
MNITFKDVEYTKPFKWQEYMNDKYMLPVNELTKHVKHTETRYTPVFFYYDCDSIIGQSLRHYGEYTQVEIDTLNNLIHKELVVYDIGANIGYHTIGLAQNAKHVYAFEPNNKNYFLLKQNTKNTKNITSYNIALGDEKKIVHISDFNLDDIGNYGECMIREDGDDDGQKIDCNKLDDFAKENDIPLPHVIKIDVEGYEYQVLKGMTKMLEQNLPIIFYEHLHGEYLPDIYDFLKEYGYKIYWYPVPNYNPNNFKQNRQNIFGNGGVINALAVPKHVNLQTNLPEKLNRDETWNDVVQRLQPKNA